MDEERKRIATTLGLAAALEVVVDALTARNPGLDVAIREELQRRVGDMMQSATPDAG